MTPAAPEAAARVAFEIPPELGDAVARTVEELREDPEDPARVRELIEIVVELTRRGLDFYFLYPLELAAVGPVSLTTARLGIAAAGRGIPRLIRRVVGSMSRDELLAVCDFLQRIVIRA